MSELLLTRADQTKVDHIQAFWARLGFPLAREGTIEYVVTTRLADEQVAKERLAQDPTLSFERALIDAENLRVEQEIEDRFNKGIWI